MDVLYIEVFNCSEDKKWKFPLESLITLYTLNAVGLDNVVKKTKIILVETTSLDPPTDAVLLDASKHEFTVIKSGESIPSEAQTFPLPVLVSNAGNVKTSVAGLSSVLRRVIRNIEEQHPLLGFRQTCLIACAEVSVWTRFCEVDVVGSVREMLKSSCPDSSSLPVDVARLEEHMAHPPRLHNIRKQRQDYAKKIGSTGEVDILHIFAEGPSMSLADVMLLPCFYILLRPFCPEVLTKVVPLVSEWMRRVQDTDVAKRAADILEMLSSQLPEPTTNKDCDLPTVPAESLYKGDVKKYKPRSNKAFTKQDIVEEALFTVYQLEHNVRPDKRPWGEDLFLHWDSLPLDARPEGGALPESRQTRKSHQLRNMARAVLKLARPGNTIVDFCSGSGHLGIALAWLLPKCQIVLLENKDRSLERARLRVKSLGLSNIELVQGNLDYFQGKFDIGVALHACGVATDLVLQCCIAQKASFVVCPCCYGAVQNSHTVTYPRSKVYRDSSLTMKQYLVLGHCADQTHGESGHKTAQGNACMVSIDVDRCLFAQEAGYQVHVTKMNPENCSPKNNLLVGISPTFSGIILDFDDMPAISRTLHLQISRLRPE